jgi:tetratricopeptide (TPR) repeat protein
MRYYHCPPCGIVREAPGGCPTCAAPLRQGSAPAGSECPNCGLGFATPRSVCPICQGPELRAQARTGRATRAAVALDRRLPISLHRATPRAAVWPSLAAVVLLVAAHLVVGVLPGPDVRTGPAGALAPAAAARPAGEAGGEVFSRERAEAFNRRGVELAHAGDVDGAILQFTRALAADARNYKSHNNLGVLYRRKGLIREAMSAYRTASEIEPANPVPYKNLAILLEQSGEGWEAQRCYARYLELAPAAADAPVIRARLANLRTRTPSAAAESADRVSRAAGGPERG